LILKVNCQFNPLFSVKQLTHKNWSDILQRSTISFNVVF